MINERVGIEKICTHNLPLLIFLFRHGARSREDAAYLLQVWRRLKRRAQSDFRNTYTILIFSPPRSHLFDNSIDIGRLLEVGRRMEVQRLDGIVLATMTSQDDDLCLWPPVVDETEHLYPVAPRHAQIQDDHRVQLPLENVPTLLAVSSLIDSHPLALERADDMPPNIDLILDD
ncbi:hypothetical protein BE15_17375 [Sorangium cellulosum]|uniref:Uncharacterized protein n=1 Tax=Sorangium cellulosum TaxID=56 RepID=A0A150PZV8_SORCE|nr:hypothetical protein BE15_17375 [Sorangium cellulosum]